MATPSIFPANVSVITVVVLGRKADQIVVQRKFRLANSRIDMRQFPRGKDGVPVIGPMVYRERTKKELKTDGLIGQPYLHTLVPLCNTGSPFVTPDQTEAYSEPHLALMKIKMTQQEIVEAVEESGLFSQEQVEALGS